MKKILSVLLALAAAFTMSTAVYAEPEKKDGATTTITFDTDVALKYIHSFGNAEEANMKFELTEDGAASGKALKVSEEVKGNLSSKYGGFYLDAADFGLEDFSGYTMKIYIKADIKAAKQTAQYELFSDGDRFDTVSFLTESAGSYRLASITVPADSKNDKIGVTFPIREKYSGDLGVFDDISITDSYGKSIVNIGDVDTSLYKAPNKIIAVLTTLLFVVVIIAVLGGAVLFVKKTVLKYR